MQQSPSPRRELSPQTARSPPRSVPTLPTSPVVNSADQLIAQERIVKSEQQEEPPIPPAVPEPAVKREGVTPAPACSPQPSRNATPVGSDLLKRKRELAEADLAVAEAKRVLIKARLAEEEERERSSSKKPKTEEAELQISQKKRPMIKDTEVCLSAIVALELIV